MRRAPLTRYISVDSVKKKDYIRVVLTINDAQVTRAGTVHEIVTDNSGLRYWNTAKGVILLQDLDAPFKPKIQLIKEAETNSPLEGL